MNLSSPTARRSIFRPLLAFIRSSSVGSALLLGSAIVALLWANSPWSPSYFDLWSTRVTIAAGGFELSKPLLLWINDGLMAIFFFVVGLEIKREILVGELSSPRQAALPLMAAVGGMVCPALIYTLFNRGGAGASGWGVPMATDIAFALGVLALLGNSVPIGLKVFVTALAIVDDLGAVLVIALFYTAKLSWSSLGVAAALFAALLVINKMGARRPLPYVLLGAALWLAVLKSGVHATIAGVLLALTIPARARLDTDEFAAQTRAILDDLEKPATSHAMPEDHGSAVQELEILCEKAESPLQRLEHALHPWVGFVIMPIFAFANAGVTLGGNALSLLAHPVSLGVALGLLAGKLLGIGGLSWLAVRAGWAQLPSGVSSRHLWGASCLCGIGFTMSLFIASLAFGDGALLDVAKTGILIGSLIAGAFGYLLLKKARPSPS